MIDLVLFVALFVLHLLFVRRNKLINNHEVRQESKEEGKKKEEK